MPEPTADQELPSQAAMREAATPPALVNSPPAKSFPWYTARASTRASVPTFGPAPSADQAFPFHLAMRFTVTPPATVKYPPA